MRIVVTGASGLIGGAAAAALAAEGHDVVAAGRRPAAGALALDLSRPDEAAWARALEGADALVNCAGLFADEAGASMRSVNVEGAAALFRACAAAGVRRVVQLSALGADAPRSRFTQSKRDADEALMALDLDWAILRPSIVFGPEANGGGGLLRGLAGLPVLPLPRHVADVQIVGLDDVAQTIVALMRPQAPSRLIVEAVGGERRSFADAVGGVRQWLGWRPAPVWRAPSWLMGLGFRLGELAGRLGWRTPIRLGAQSELRRGSVGDARALTALLGRAPRGLGELLASRRASTQERAYAALYFTTPLVIGVTSLFFIATGVASLTFGYDIGVDLLQRGGLGALSGPAVIAGGLADIVAGLVIAWRPTARLGLWAAIALSLFYFAAGTILLPELWLDPIGPMLKIWPLIVLNIVGLAVVRDR